MKIIKIIIIGIFIILTPICVWTFRLQRNQCIMTAEIGQKLDQSYMNLLEIMHDCYINPELPSCEKREVMNSILIHGIIVDRYRQSSNKCLE